MTKLRAPASFELALDRIASVIGWDGAARAVSRSKRTVRAWSDPDGDSSPTIEQAFALDAAYRRAGGGDCPFHQVYALRLDLEEPHCLDSARLIADTASAAKEAGEAISALVIASGPDASAAHRARALLEAQEACDALTRAMASLAVPPGTLVRDIT